MNKYHFCVDSCQSLKLDQATMFKWQSPIKNKTCSIWSQETLHQSSQDFSSRKLRQLPHDKMLSTARTQMPKTPSYLIALVRTLMLEFSSDWYPFIGWVVSDLEIHRCEPEPLAIGAWISTWQVIVPFIWPRLGISGRIDILFGLCCRWQEPADSPVAILCLLGQVVKYQPVTITSGDDILRQFWERTYSHTQPLENASSAKTNTTCWNVFLCRRLRTIILQAAATTRSF